MKKKANGRKRDSERDTMRAEYDFTAMKGGVRGKHAKRYQAGTNLVLLDPDVWKAFRNERAVNDALRLVIELRRIGTGRARVT